MRKAIPIVAAVSLFAGGCGGGGSDDARPPDETAPDTLPPTDGDVPGGAPGTDEPSVVPDDGVAPDVVDCAGAVPCSGTEAGGALSIRLTAAQGEQASGSGDFRVDFAVAAVRGGDVGVLRTSTLAAGEARLDAALVTIAGQGSGFGDAASAALEASSEVPASVEFIGSLPDDVRLLDVVTIELLDGDRATRLLFANVPVGLPDDAVDCASTLPCAWTSPDGAVTVTVDDIAPRVVDERDALAVAYGVSSTRAVTLAAEGYTNASGSGGESFVQSVLEFDGTASRFGARLVATLSPDGAIRATVELESESTGASAGGALDTLRLSLFEVAEPRLPFWNPVFTNLPIGG